MNKVHRGKVSLLGRTQKARTLLNPNTETELIAVLCWPSVFGVGNVARSQLTAGIYCDTILFRFASGPATDQINQCKNKKLRKSNKEFSKQSSQDYPVSILLPVYTSTACIQFITYTESRKQSSKQHKYKYAANTE